MILSKRCIIHLVVLFVLTYGPLASAEVINGHVRGEGGPIANSTVTLWAAGQDAPRKLAGTKTRDDRRD